MSMFGHPRLKEIQCYTAMRLGCQINTFERQGSIILSATPPIDKNLLVTLALDRADVICLTQMKTCSIVRKNLQETKAVKNLLQKIDRSKILSPEDFLKFANVKKNGSSEPYFYLALQNFKPFPDPNVLELSQDNPEHIAMVAELHQTIEENMRWFVEIDHPIVYGYIINQKLVGIASHFLFESPEFKVAAGGALVHPEYRQRNIGKAVVSAICQWALERDYIVEWSSWSQNIASIALAKSLGFKQFLSEHEFIVS